MFSTQERILSDRIFKNVRIGNFLVKQSVSKIGQIEFCSLDSTLHQSTDKIFFILIFLIRHKNSHFIFFFYEIIFFNLPKSLNLKLYKNKIMPKKLSLFAAISGFLLPISLQPNVVHH